MSLYEKFFMNKDKKFKKNLQKWMFLKAQTFLYHSKPLSQYPNLDPTKK